MSDKCPKCGAAFKRTKPGGERVYECMSYSLKRPYCETDVFFESHQCTRNQLATANAVIASLPKTADGVPVVPGMKVFYLHAGGHTIIEYSIAGYITYANGAICVYLEPRGFSTIWQWSQCYSTKAAAQAAAQEVK